MKEGLYTENIWAIISEEITKNKGRSYLAVPYFGSNGAKKLPLKKGSILIVNASKGVVESGATDPRELVKLIKLGVSVYSYSDLHSKIYLTKSSLIVGSANATDNSANNLHEAIWYSKDKIEIQKGIDYVKSFVRPNLSLSIEELNKLIPFFNTKPRDSFKVKSSDLPKVKILEFVKEELPPSYDEALGITLERNKSEIQEYKDFKIEDMDWDERIISGTIVLQVYSVRGKVKYYPLSTVIECEPYLNKKGERSYVLLLKAPKYKKSIDSAKLKELVHKDNLKYFKSDRKLLPNKVAKILFDYWNFLGKKTQ